MTLTKIGNERWDLVDSAGDEIRLPQAGAPVVAFPTRWRFFVPRTALIKTDAERMAAAATADATVKGHTTLPDTLAMDDQTLDSRDIDFDGDTVNLGKLFGGYESVSFRERPALAGQQAYAFVELELGEETDVPFGAGSDYFMRWWIDGEPVCDTIEQGNQVHPPGRTDHVFNRRLDPGKHLLAVWLIGGQGSWILKAGVLTDQDAMLASVTFSDRWQFLPDIEEIRPPRRAGAASGCTLDWGHTMGFAADRCLADETIECDFQLGPEGNFGVILGA